MTEGSDLLMHLLLSPLYILLIVVLLTLISNLFAGLQSNLSQTTPDASQAIASASQNVSFLGYAYLFLISPITDVVGLALLVVGLLYKVLESPSSSQSGGFLA